MFTDTKALDEKYIAHTYARFPTEIVGGKNAVLTDSSGIDYIDMGSGIGVNAFGTCDEQWVSAVEAQLHLFGHTSNLYYTRPCAELAALLCERTGMKKVFFSNSGAEANECAIKLARAYGEKKSEGCYNIITLENSFHGRTLATLAATGQSHYHEKYRPLPEGFIHTPANDCAALEKAAAENDCCAIMVEIIQGEGGVNVLSEQFVRCVERTARLHDLLLIIDEVQTGNGRTGQLYSYMHFNLKPDVFTTAKGLGGGLPIGACVMGEKTADLFSPGDNGSTFGANPIVCAGALSVLSRLDDAFLSEVTKKGEYFKEKLLSLDGVQSVSGMGLMLGVKCEKPASAVTSLARENGVLCLTAKDKVRLLPPLTVSYEQIDKAVYAIGQALKGE